LSVSPPSSPPSLSPPNHEEIGDVSSANRKDKDGGAGVPKEAKSKSKKRKSDVLEQVEEPNVEEAQVKTKKDTKDKADKKDKKDKKEQKEKKEKKEKSIPAQGDSVENDIGRAPVPPSNLASASTTIPLETEGPKRKKEKKSKSTQVNEGESTPKTKKQKKSKPPLPLPPNGPGPSNSTPGMNGPDELSSDEADIFEIDELLPSSPVLPSPPPLPSQNQNEIISQPTPTPKPRRKRVSDSSGFDTPSAPDHLRHPHPLINITGSGDTPSRLGRIGGTPIKKALVRLGASWVTSTPVPK
jgi:hypothetical protein